MTAPESAVAVDLSAAMRPRVRPTAIGWGFVGLIGCELLMALNFNNNPLFAMTFLLVAVMATAWWKTRRNLSSLGVRRWQTQAVFAGQVLDYRLEILEQGGFRHYSIGAEAEIDGACVAVNTDTGGKAVLHIRHTALKRGLTPVASVNLASEYPLGLFRAVAPVPPLPVVPVYPAACGRQPLPGARQDETSYAHAEADTLSSLRRYQDGDRISRIAWKASARSMDLLSSEFDGADDPNGIVLDLDRAESMDIEAKLSQLCRWVLTAQQQGVAYRLLLPGVSLGPDNDERHLRACLRALALFGQQESRS